MFTAAEAREISLTGKQKHIDDLRDTILKSIESSAIKGYNTTEVELTKYGEKCVSLLIKELEENGFVVEINPLHDGTYDKENYKNCNVLLIKW
jgi:hypothetical protein